MSEGDGNGWVSCRCGHRHWGRHGAAGLLLLRPCPEPVAVELLLQLRASWTHLGGTWGLPGGATDSHETPTESALREAWEEAGVPPSDVEVVATTVSTDHEDWTYTVVVGKARGEVAGYAANAESAAVRWVPHEDVKVLPLHPGLAASWSQLSRLVLEVRA